MRSAAPQELFNARYIAIRAAEARGLTERLLQAARDRDPAVRRLLVPILFRAWHRDHDAGWRLLSQIGDEMIRFPGRLHGPAVEVFVELSLAVANHSRGDREQLDRLGAIWRDQVERIFSTPLAKTLGRGWVMRMLARPFKWVLERQPAYQPFNFKEFEASAGRRAAFSETWHRGRTCLEHPENGLGPIGEIFGGAEIPFDLHLMLLCERTLVYHAVKVNPAKTFELLKRLFESGCPWFRQSVLYVLFHQLSNLPAVEAAWLDRYVALTAEFFTSGSWQMHSPVAAYKFSDHLAWPELVVDRWAPATAPRLIPSLLGQALAAGDEDQIDGLFKAIDIIAFTHRRSALALSILDRCLAIGRETLEERILSSLATVRLQDQALVDAFIDEHRDLARLRPRIETAAPALLEEDIPTLLDGLFVQLLLNAEHFRGKLCDAFRQASAANSATELLVILIAWMRDELRHLDARPAQ
jgi:hypothetical protein